MKKMRIEKEYIIAIAIAIIVLVPLWLCWFNVSFCGVFGQHPGNILCDLTGIFNGLTNYFEDYIFTSCGTGYCYCLTCVNPKLVLITTFFIVALFIIFICKKIKFRASLNLLKRKLFL